MTYLNCPSCRLTVYSSARESTTERCPRCKATLGKARRLFRSALPSRFSRAARAKAT